MPANATSGSSDGEGQDAPTRVLVTGGTGYLAAWLITELLRRGNRTRTTVRNPGKIGQVRAALGERLDDVGVAEVEFAIADLLDDEGWDDAVAGMDYVLHTASPLVAGTGEDLITIAREGVRRVMGAAGRAGVRRVVLTSSAVTAIPGDAGQIADESVWAQATDNPAAAYDASKILAERDAWKIAADDGVELTAVLPTFMQGPVLGVPAEIGSVEAVRRLLSGGLPAIPNVGWDIVDVRDVADLHILAMAAPAAAGQRLLASGGFLWWREIAALLRDDLSEDAKKVPTRVMPDLLVRIVARFNQQMAGIRPNLNRRVVVDSSRARDQLGWESRPTRETIIETAESLIAKGAVG